MSKTIYFDMDGTIANLYGVEGWLPCIEAGSTKPYELALPMIDLEETRILLNLLRGLGYKIGVISWLARGGSTEYNRAITRVKREWLKKHINFKFDTIDIVEYGTPKHSIGKGIIFDDDSRVRDAWRGRAIDPTNVNINDYLTSLL